MPTENLTDENLAIDDTYGNDLRCGDMEVDKVADIVVKILNEDFTDFTLASGDTSSSTILATTMMMMMMILILSSGGLFVASILWEPLN